jgi:hypothetical protein
MVHLNRHNFLGVVMNTSSTIIRVIRTTEDMYNARLAVVNAGHKNGVEDLHDIYCLAIALADHITIVENGDPLAELSKDEIMNKLVLAKFLDQDGKFLIGDYHVSLHFTPLQKHFIVTPTGNGGNIVFFNKKDKTTNVDFELGAVIPQKDVYGVATGECEYLPTLTDDSAMGSVISLLGLSPFLMEPSGKKVRVPSGYKNGGFLMQGNVKTPPSAQVKDIDAIAMTRYLQEHRQTLGSAAKRMCDVFGMHILLADYELRIPKGANGADLNKEQFLTFLVKTQFLAPNGSAVASGKTICVHHQALQMHCLVKVMENGSNQAFYHKSLRDDIERFLVACIRPEGEGYYEGFTLKEQAHDITALNLALGHVNFDADTGRTLIPEKHRNYESQMMDRVKFGYTR